MNIRAGKIIQSPANAMYLIVLFLCVVAVGCKEEGDNPVTPVPNTVTDIDGNVYHTVTIGTQTWMVENLKATRYNDGTPIPMEADGTAWWQLQTPIYCWYNNDVATKQSSYGALYNWYATNTGKLAPTGWHVPTDSEWTILFNYLGGKSVAGRKMKESGTSHWSDPSSSGDNRSGFTALPGGRRVSTGLFSDIGSYGNWWSSVASDEMAWYYILGSGVGVYRNFTYKYCGFSVRCVKDN